MSVLQPATAPARPPLSSQASVARCPLQTDQDQLEDGKTFRTLIGFSPGPRRSPALGGGAGYPQRSCAAPPSAGINVTGDNDNHRQLRRPLISRAPSPDRAGARCRKNLQHAAYPPYEDQVSLPTHATEWSRARWLYAASPFRGTLAGDLSRVDGEWRTKFVP